MNKTIAASAGEDRLLARGSLCGAGLQPRTPALRSAAGTGDPSPERCAPPTPLKTLHTHLEQRAGPLVLARGLAVQIAVADGRALRGGEQDPFIFARRRPKRPAWRAGEVSPSSPEGHPGWSNRSRGPQCHLQLTPLPLGSVWWERCWRPEIWGAAAEVLFAGHPMGCGCRPSPVGGWPGAVEQGRRGAAACREDATAQPRREGPAVREARFRPEPASSASPARRRFVLRGPGRQPANPPSLPPLSRQGVLGGHFSLGPQANASVARTSATF